MEEEKKKNEPKYVTNKYGIKTLVSGSAKEEKQ